MNDPTHKKLVLYNQYARYYDYLHEQKDYAAQSNILLSIFTKLNVKKCAHILEAACGTGSYLHKLQKFYAVAGFDNSQEMLKLAQQKVPCGYFWNDDLRNFTTHSQVDVVLCLCSAIAYLSNEIELRSSFHCMNKALVRNGVLLIRPWLTPDQVKSGMYWYDRHQDSDLLITRKAVLEQEANKSILKFECCIDEKGERPIYFDDSHKLTLFTDAQIYHALADAGFATEKYATKEFGQYLWLARKLT